MVEETDRYSQIPSPGIGLELLMVPTPVIPALGGRRISSSVPANNKHKTTNQKWVPEDAAVQDLMAEVG